MSMQIVGQLITFNFYGYLTLFDHIEKNELGIPVRKHWEVLTVLSLSEHQGLRDLSRHI